MYQCQLSNCGLHSVYYITQNRDISLVRTYNDRAVGDAVRNVDNTDIKNDCFQLIPFCVRFW